MTYSMFSIQILLHIMIKVHIQINNTNTIRNIYNSNTTPDDQWNVLYCDEQL